MGPLNDKPQGDSPVVQQEKSQKRADQLGYIRRILQTRTSDVEQRNCIGQAIQIAFDFDAKEEQVEALWRLLIRKQDTILVVQTSFGKSLIFQMLPRLVSGAIIIIILPLNAIGKDQWIKMQELPGAHPITLCAGNNSEITLQRIRRGMYTHVLMSPEIACSEHFRETVLNDPGFKSMVTVDEVHLVIDWGTSFRKSYHSTGDWR
jgi:superfamily II DNA helicase RecQ